MDSKNIYNNFIIGGIAGGLSRSVTSPLEVTKVLQQNYHKVTEKNLF